MPPLGTWWEELQHCLLFLYKAKTARDNINIPLTSSRDVKRRFHSKYDREKWMIMFLERLEVSLLSRIITQYRVVWKRVSQSTKRYGSRVISSMKDILKYLYSLIYIRVTKAFFISFFYTFFLRKVVITFLSPSFKNGNRFYPINPKNLFKKISRLKT